jgi:hypothetical protein
VGLVDRVSVQQARPLVRGNPQPSYIGNNNSFQFTENFTYSFLNLFSVLCSKLLHQNRIRIYDTGFLYCLLFNKYIHCVSASHSVAIIFIDIYLVSASPSVAIYFIDIYLISASPSVAICTICVSCSRLRFS